MSVAGFLLSLAVIAAVSSTVTAVAGGVMLALVSRLRPSPARAADLALFVGLAPGMVAVVIAALVALPALFAATGVLPDHCLQHAHHGHLCPLHLATVPAWVAVVGSFVSLIAVGRFLVRAFDHREEQRLWRGLIAVGAAHVDRVVVVDGPPTLLHAGDDVIVASATLLCALDDTMRRAVLAHETAHLRRRDSRSLHALLFAEALSPPAYGAAVVRRFRQAAEEAADEAAAVVVGAVDVAAAIVAVARARQGSRFDHARPAIAGGDLERRVRRLLSIEPRERRAGAHVVVAAFVVFIVAALPLFADVHHVAESAFAPAAHTHVHR